MHNNKEFVYKVKLFIIVTYYNYDFIFGRMYSQTEIQLLTAKYLKINGNTI